MKFESIAVTGIAIMFCCVVGWIVSDHMRPYKDATGELNASAVGSAFGSAGKDDVRWFKMIVEEIKPGGFVAVRFGKGDFGGYYGAINPIDGVPDLAVGDWVRVEDRLYVASDDDSEPKTIRLITKRLGE